MFKSVFAKYISVFMLIILISFAMLTAITVTVVNGYASEAKVKTLSQTAEAATDYIENDISKGGDMKLSVYVNSRRDSLGSVIRAYASSDEDLSVLIVSNRGKVLFYADSGSYSAELDSIVPDEDLSPTFDQQEY